MKETKESLIKEMSLEEKAGLCSGKDTWRLKGIPRLDIPEIAVSDGPHGLRKQEAESDHLGINDSKKSVCFPAACATAASFDTELLKDLGELLGDECVAENISVLLGPAMNIKRSPLCGRNFEYFSEDPYLTGRLAAAQIKGIQSRSVGACPKHFAANNQEFRRMTNSSNADEKTLREIYLSAFEYVVKEAKPWSMMCSYNKINGVYASENKWLLNDILRDEWGFEGFVMSDWGAVNKRVHALNAGLDLEMPYSGGLNDRKIVQAVESGEIKEDTLNKSVDRILEAILKSEKKNESSVPYDRELHHKKSAQLAKECAVLLKNNGTLPLDRNKKTVYIGSYAEKPRYQGGGSSHINSYRVTGALECADRDNTAYIPLFDGKTELTSTHLDAIAEADSAVIFAGLPDLYESEGYDRETMRLPEEQNDAIFKIASVQKNTIVVLHIGSPVEMPWIDDVAAVLCMYLAGEGVGEATDALLYGDANPCGRLPETFPLRLQDNPTYLNYGCDEDDAFYSEGCYVGYRYYNTKNMPVLFPFGHGLSYTEFEYSDFKLSKNSLKAGEHLTAELTVKNIGKKAGKEVLQFYAQNTSVKNSPARLCGFEKIFLLPGESKKILVGIDYRTFQDYYTKAKKFLCNGGDFKIYAAKNSREYYGESTVSVERDGILPFEVDENTTVAALLSHPKTGGAMGMLLNRFAAAVKSDNQDEQTKKIMHEMVLNVPLRGLGNFGLLDNRQIDDLIENMNSLIKK